MAGTVEYLLSLFLVPAWGLGFGRCSASVDLIWVQLSAWRVSLSVGRLLLVLLLILLLGLLVLLLWLLLSIVAFSIIIKTGLSSRFLIISVLVRLVQVRGMRRGQVGCIAARRLLLVWRLLIWLLLVRWLLLSIVAGVRLCIAIVVKYWLMDIPTILLLTWSLILSLRARIVSLLGRLRLGLVIGWRGRRWWKNEASVIVCVSL